MTNIVIQEAETALVPFIITSLATTLSTVVASHLAAHPSKNQLVNELEQFVQNALAAIASSVVAPINSTGK